MIRYAESHDKRFPQLFRNDKKAPSAQHNRKGAKDAKKKKKEKTLRSLRLCGSYFPIPQESACGATGIQDCLLVNTTFSLYLHIPFCRHRCAYCDFNTYTSLAQLQPAYAAALADEIRLVGAAGDQPPAGALSP